MVLRKFSGKFVGGDACIAPLESCEFAENFRKSGLCRRVDVGIDPYACVRAYTCYDSGRHLWMAAAFGVFQKICRI